MFRFIHNWFSRRRIARAQARIDDREAIARSIIAAATAGADEATRQAREARERDDMRGYGRECQTAARYRNAALIAELNAGAEAKRR